jgi:hypothetical protein
VLNEKRKKKEKNKKKKQKYTQMERGERERERKVKNDPRNLTMRDKRGVAEEWVNDEEEEKKKEPWLAIQTCHGMFTVLLVKSPTKNLWEPAPPSFGKKLHPLDGHILVLSVHGKKNIHQQKRTAGSTSRSNKQTINSTDKCFLQKEKRAGFVMTREIERT